jgi:phosphoglycolate phosphatase
MVKSPVGLRSDAMLLLMTGVLVLWDIDHTLIENGGVSKENYALAFELLTGRVPGVQPRTDGRTDTAIMSDLLTANGVGADAFTFDEQVAALAEAGVRNRDRLVARGSALPGAVECLEHLSAVGGVVQSVLTGNIEPNARVKLGAFGLDKYIEFGAGGFGADDAIRARLVPIAQARAGRLFGFDPVRDVTVLIGDTTLDVAAGLAGGGRVLGVATGISTVDELRVAGADAVLPGLADLDAFIQALRTVRAMGPTGPRDQAAGG